MRLSFGSLNYKRGFNKMTKQQKTNIIINCLAGGIEITPQKLSQLEYERKHRRDQERFILRRIPTYASNK